MSYNFLDKSGLTYFWDKIKGIFLRLSGGTMTGQLKTSFKSSVATGSYNATGGTLANICQELRYSSGCMGSVALSSDYSGYGCSLPSGWYNFLWIPHRSGGVNGVASGDNCDYGTLLISGMNNTIAMHRVRFSGGAISDVKKIDAPTDYIANSNFYVNTHPENAPVLIPFIHNDIAYLLKRGGSRKIYYDGVEQNLDINNVFDGSPSYWAINPTGTTEIIIELTLHKVFAWTNTIYCDFGASGWRAKNVKIEVMNTNYESDVWTSKYNTTANGSGNVKTTFSHTPVGASNAGGGFNKIRFTFSNWNNATIFRISQLGVYNYGSSGVRETYMSRGIDDYVFRNITPNSNNTFNLGSSSNKWANVYATTFQGNATSATKATGDKNGADITTTYQKKLTAGTNITIDANNIISASGGGSEDYVIEFPESWFDIIDEYEQTGSYLPFTVSVLASTYTGIENDHAHYIVSSDLYNTIDQVLQRSLTEVKLNLTNTATYMDTCVESTMVILDNGFLKIIFEDNARILDYSTGGKVTIDGPFVRSGNSYYRIKCDMSRLDDAEYMYSNVCESAYNKVTSISSSSTNTEYPSALAVYNYVNSAGGGITIDDVYPVGSIYMSVNNTNPSTLFGGTWEQLKDRFLLGAGDTYTGGNTGGSATKTIAKANLPNYTLYSASHSHQIKSYGGYSGSTNNPGSAEGTNQGTKTGSTEGATITVNSGGSGTALDIMPPYLVVYMWKRTA